MKPLKPRDKVTQRMTRAGLTLDNQPPARARAFPAGKLSRNIPPSRTVQWKRRWNGP